LVTPSNRSRWNAPYRPDSDGLGGSQPLRKARGGFSIWRRPPPVSEVALPFTEGSSGPQGAETYLDSGPRGATVTGGSQVTENNPSRFALMAVHIMSRCSVVSSVPAEPSYITFRGSVALCGRLK
jgi:hypothetical protein